MKKVNNFQEEFSLQDIEVARDVSATYDCGLSRIALKSPEQVCKSSRNYKAIAHGGTASTVAMTLRLYYAIQVWRKAVHISFNGSSELSYYWWLDWKSDERPFNRIEYRKFDSNITIEQLLFDFWKLLEKIADSGEIKVSEGYQFENDVDGITKIKCTIFLDAASGRDVEKQVRHVINHPFNRTLKTYKWCEIKDLFCELTLNQLRLTMPDKLHNHTDLDDLLLTACTNWNMETIQSSLQKGANINCLDQKGESVLQKVVEFYKSYNVQLNKDYSKEELKEIEVENEMKCKNIVDFLLSQGAEINLFGFEGLSPLVCAYYERSPEMIKFLLDRGAEPNVNCYLEDIEDWSMLKNIRSTILDSIDGLMAEDYDDVQKEIEQIIRAAGGRLYSWDYNPWTYSNIGKYYIHMVPPVQGDDLFYDNSDWSIGSVRQLNVEDKDGRKTIILLDKIEGLDRWIEDYQKNLTNPDYDWLSWKNRGFELAHEIAKLLSDFSSLYFLYDNEQIVEKAPCRSSERFLPNEMRLCRDGKPIRIK